MAAPIEDAADLAAALKFLERLDEGVIGQAALLLKVHLFQQTHSAGFASTTRDRSGTPKVRISSLKS
jgi:hypothetical protein